MCLRVGHYQTLCSTLGRWECHQCGSLQCQEDCERLLSVQGAMENRQKNRAYAEIRREKRRARAVRKAEQSQPLTRAQQARQELSKLAAGEKND